MYCLSVYPIWTQRYHPFSDMTTDHWCLSLTEVCVKVLSEKNAYKSVKTALLLSNVIDGTTKTAVCLQTKAIFHHLYVF